MYEIKNKSVTRGGKRSGAGRKSLYGTPTKAIRVPEHMVAEVRDFVESQNLAEYELPLFASTVAAGFPSPADDFMDTKLDLNTHLIKTPSATFFVRVAGESMKDIGITDGDILVVDRSIESWGNRIVVAVIDSEFTIKRFTTQNETVVLEAENPDYLAIKITPEMDFSVWGVVSWTLKKL